MLDFLGDLKRTHMCGELRASDAGSKVVLMGWVNRRRDLGNLIFLDLRDRTGITQVVVTADAGAEVHDKADRGALGVRRRRHRPREAARRRHGQQEHSHRRDRSRRRRAAPAERLQAAALLARRHRARQRRGAPEVSLRRPAPARDAAQHRAAPQGRDRHSRVPERAGLLRDRDAVHDALHARRRARLPGAQPRPSRRVLRAAAVAADVQADPDDLRLRQVLPDRALLPRRRPARRPPARVHADRSGDQLPASGNGLRRRRRLSDGGVQDHRRRSADAVSADELRRGDPPVRHRQARPAPARDGRRARGVSRPRISRR